MDKTLNQAQKHLLLGVSKTRLINRWCKKQYIQTYFIWSKDKNSLTFTHCVTLLVTYTLLNDRNSLWHCSQSGLWGKGRFSESKNCRWIKLCAFLTHKMLNMLKGRGQITFRLRNATCPLNLLSNTLNHYSKNWFSLAVQHVFVQYDFECTIWFLSAPCSKYFTM